MGLSDSASPANGLPAWETPADPSSAPTDLAPMMSSESCLSDLAPALASPASSPKSPSTGIGSPRSPTAPSKMQPVVLFKDSAIMFCLLFFFFFFFFKKKRFFKKKKKKKKK